MAKIATGPLAAGLSGKLGPVVFHQTKFGQVVQSKAKAKIYSTPAALETKQTFALAARMWGTIPAIWKGQYSAFGDSIGRSGQGMVISSLMSLIRTGDAGSMPTTGIQKQPSFGAPFYSGGRWRIPATDPNGFDVLWLTHGWQFGPDGRVTRAMLAPVIAGNVSFGPSDATPFDYFWTAKLDGLFIIFGQTLNHFCLPVGIRT